MTTQAETTPSYYITTPNWATQELPHSRIAVGKHVTRPASMNPGVTSGPDRAITGFERLNHTNPANLTITS